MAAKSSRLGFWIAVGLLAGALCGVLFGDYCAILEPAGRAYVGLLQMTVLPYLVFALVAKTAKLDLSLASRLGLTALATLLLLWAIGIFLIVAVTMMLPPIAGASFFSPTHDSAEVAKSDWISLFIPSNVFRSLADEAVPAVVVFCLFLGASLILVPRKERLLEVLDLCVTGIGRINSFLVTVSPVGLFMLTAATAGTVRLEEITRLQSYLIMFGFACVIAVLIILPLIVSSVTRLGYWEIMREAQEPLLTAIATGKLLIVLPQIIEKCEELVATAVDGEPDDEASDSMVSVLVPIAYTFPHLGKILAFIFIAFAAWHVDQALSPDQTARMAAMGTVSSFASPLVTIPLLLDQYQLPQDLFVLFLLPGFMTTRLADAVGAMHLITLTVIVAVFLHGKLHVRWRRVGLSLGFVTVCLVAGAGFGRWYLGSTTLDYKLDDQLLSMSIPIPHDDVVVFDSAGDAETRSAAIGSALQRVREEGVLRVGFHPYHLPYSYFNSSGDLVGLDIDLMHRLATRLKVRLEFVPYRHEDVIEQLDDGVIDVAAGGLVMKPERLILAGFTQPYQIATIAIVLPDYRQREFAAWDDAEWETELKIAVPYDDLVLPAQRQLPNAEVVAIESIRSFFAAKDPTFDAIIMQAEEAAAWNILYPEYTIVVPKPVVQRPVGLALRSGDVEWQQFLDRWLDFERLDGSLDRLQEYWIQGGGTKDTSRRWCVLRDVLHWLP